MPLPDDTGPDVASVRRRWKRPRWTQLLGGAVLLFLAVSAVLLLTDPGEETPPGHTGVTSAVPAGPDGTAAVALDPAGAACLGFGGLLTSHRLSLNGGDRQGLEVLAANASALATPLDVAGIHLAEAARLARLSIERGRAGDHDGSLANYQLAGLARAEALVAARDQGCLAEPVSLSPASATPRPPVRDDDRLLGVLRDTYRSRAEGVSPTGAAARAELYREIGTVASGMDATVAPLTCTAGFLTGMVARTEDLLEGYLIFASVLDVCIDVGAVDERIGRSEFRGE